jgi:DNA-binding transcriptional ArsR family regulator
MTVDRLSLVFGALADPIRRAILTRLTEGDATVAELAAPFSNEMCSEWYAMVAGAAKRRS